MSRDLIFPGMDSYLEDPARWPGVHAAFIVYLRDQLQPQLRPRYLAAVEERVYLEGPNRDVIPDVWLKSIDGPRSPWGDLAVRSAAGDASPVVVEAEPLAVRESYVAILDIKTNRQVVTIIEVLSPANKFAGPGQRSYLAKQRDILASGTNLVEIDLLRAGAHVLAVPVEKLRPYPHDYLACVNRAAETRHRYELYPMRLRQPLSRIHIPLAAEDADVKLNLQSVFAQVYEAGIYRERIDYSAPCVPPLAERDEPWAKELLAAKLA